MTVCRKCGCSTSQAAADALVLGFQEEFQAGIYSCCQVVAWADEQWMAWTEAAVEDGRSSEEATKPLEIMDCPGLVPIRFHVYPDTN
jgi:hypothetical protein